MKNIFFLCLLYIIGNKANAQGAITIANHSPCSVTVTPIGIAPLEGYNCSCAACPVVANPYTLTTTITSLTATNYCGYTPSYVSYPTCVASDFSWIAMYFSYDCTGTPLAGCEPTGSLIVGATCLSCYPGISSSFSVTSCLHLFNVTFAPVCPTPSTAAAIDIC